MRNALSWELYRNCSIFSRSLMCLAEKYQHSILCRVTMQWHVLVCLLFAQGNYKFGLIFNDAKSIRHWTSKTRIYLKLHWCKLNSIDFWHFPTRFWIWCGWFCFLFQYPMRFFTWADQSLAKHVWSRSCNTTRRRHHEFWLTEVSDEWL